MLISINWIKEFVTLPEMDFDDIANNFTMATAEVEGVETTNGHLEKIVVAEIKSLKKHPEADKLNLVTIDYGNKEKEVVCGASNVREGLKIPYAPLGTTLPGGFTLEAKKIRGILSEGMLCSEEELGYPVTLDGLMELPSDAKVGMVMSEHLGANADVVLDVDNKSLTHRPDLWGHYGLAREFACYYKQDLKDSYGSDWVKNLEKNFSDKASPITPNVEKDSSCLAYYGLSLDGITVGESPSWLKDKIEACGLRSINNIVDVSNYVMLELGIPLHIFDRDLIKDNTIHIKRSGVDQEFTTLDEEKRKLVPHDTVICDSEKPLVLAGIMGGLNSGVNDKTSKIFIEVANWKAAETRHTSTRLGLRTDSSSRYEKSLDSHLCYRTLLRTMEIILKLNKDAKVIGKPEYDGENLSETKELTISTSVDHINSTLGHETSKEEILRIFSGLGFSSKENKSQLAVTIPTFRTTKDISIEADLVEEIGRMIGYDNIVPTSPNMGIQPMRLSPDKLMTRKIQDFMVLNGSSTEVMTYPLIGENLLKKSGWSTLNEELVLVNALSKDANRMRPSLVPHGLQTVQVNAKNSDQFSFFEIGRSYLEDEKDFSKERTQLFIGEFSKKENTFVTLLNKVESLLTYLQISFDVTDQLGKFTNPLMSADWKGAHPYELQHIRIMGKFHGIANTVHPLLLRDFKVKGNFSFAVIDLTDFFSRPLKSKTKYSALSKFPSSQFDCTVVVPNDVYAAEVLNSLSKVKIKELKNYKVADIFQLNENEKALTLSMIFEDREKTMGSEVIKANEGSIVAALEKAGFPLKQ